MMTEKGKWQSSMTRTYRGFSGRHINGILPGRENFCRKGILPGRENFCQKGILPGRQEVGRKDEEVSA